MCKDGFITSDALNDGIHDSCCCCGDGSGNEEKVKGQNHHEIPAIVYTVFPLPGEEERIPDDVEAGLPPGCCCSRRSHALTGGESSEAESWRRWERRPW